MSETDWVQALSSGEQRLAEAHVLAKINLITKKMKGCNQ